MTAAGALYITRSRSSLHHDSTDVDAMYEKRESSSTDVMEPADVLKVVSTRLPKLPHWVLQHRNTI